MVGGAPDTFHSHPTTPHKMQSILVLLLAVFTVVVSQLQPAPFLYNQPYAKRWEFENLLASSQGLPKTEIDNRVIAWVARQDRYIQQEWAAFNQRMSQAQYEYQYRLARFSPEARKADARLTQIANSPYFSSEEKGYLVHQVIDSLPPSAKQEIIDVLLAARPQ